MFVGTILRLVWVCVHFLMVRISFVMTGVCQFFLWLSLLLSWMHYMGWADRMIWWLVEWAVTMLLNGTPVTVGSVEVDLWRGRAWFTNVVIHTPQREEWKWDSPLIARVGKIYVETNFVTCHCLHMIRLLYTSIYNQCWVVWLDMAQEPLPTPVERLELYTVELSDVQGFVERRQHIFNVYLLDKCFELPPAEEVLQHEEETLVRMKRSKQASSTEQQQQQQHNSTHNLLQETSTAATATSFSTTTTMTPKTVTPSAAPTPVPADLTQSEIMDLDASTATMEESEDIVGNLLLPSLLDDEDPNHHADVVVDSLPSTTTTGHHHPLRSDANSIGPPIASFEELPMDQRAHQLVNDMVQAVKSLSKAAQEGSLSGALVAHRSMITSKLKQLQGTKDKAGAMQQGARVIRHMGKAVAKKTKEGVVLPMPPRHAGEVNPMDVRVGRIVIRDVRVFTSSRNYLKHKTTRANPFEEEDEIMDDLSIPVVQSSTLPSTTSGSWNKPIVMHELVIRAAELCPPLSLLDDRSLPAVYQPLDKVLDVVVKRLLAGMAKSNTSLFLNTALDEVMDLEYWNLATSSGSPIAPHHHHHPPAAAAPANNHSKFQPAASNHESSSSSSSDHPLQNAASTNPLPMTTTTTTTGQTNNPSEEAALENVSSRSLGTRSTTNRSRTSTLTSL